MEEQPRNAPEKTVVRAGSYLNKLSGERIERECRLRLEAGCRLLVVDFRETEVVNSIGIAILLGIIEAAQQAGARVVFSAVNVQTAALFEMLGLTRYVSISEEDLDASPRSVWPLDC